MPDFVTLLHHASLYEAQQLRNLLADVEIPAFIDSEASTSMMGHQMLDVRLMVQDKHEQEAREILRDAVNQATAEHGPDWFCGTCEEVIEGAFDVCWSCGESREDVARDSPRHLAAGATDSSELPTASVAIPELDRTFDRSLNERNPYAPSSLFAGSSADIEGPLTEEANQHLKRALMASAVGLLIIPVLMNAYSIHLLLSFPPSNWDASARSRLYAAWGLNLLSILCWGIYFAVSVV